jgi:hypothetical protein
MGARRPKPPKGDSEATGRLPRPARSPRAPPARRSRSRAGTPTRSSGSRRWDRPASTANRRLTPRPSLLADHREAQPLGQERAHRVLHRDVRAGHEVASFLGGDALRPDAAPGDGECALHCADATSVSERSSVGSVTENQSGDDQEEQRPACRGEAATWRGRRPVIGPRIPGSWRRRAAPRRAGAR